MDLLGDERQQRRGDPDDDVEHGVQRVDGVEVTVPEPLPAAADVPVGEHVGEATARGRRRRTGRRRPSPPSCPRRAGGSWPARSGRARCSTPRPAPRTRRCPATLASEHAADAGVGYVTPGNRFWPAALAAGLVTARPRPAPRAASHHGIGMTDLVKRATPPRRALTRDEYRGRRRRASTGCARGCSRGRSASSAWPAGAPPSTAAPRPGWQDRPLGGRPVYVMPSTSGLNAATPAGRRWSTTSRAAAAEHLTERSSTVPGMAVRLEPQDEYMHELGPEPNFNESMYFNLYDPAGRGRLVPRGNAPMPDAEPLDAVVRGHDDLRVLVRRIGEEMQKDELAMAACAGSARCPDKVVTVVAGPAGGAHRQRRGVRRDRRRAGLPPVRAPTLTRRAVPRVLDVETPRPARWRQPCRATPDRRRRPDQAVRRRARRRRPELHRAARAWSPASSARTAPARRPRCAAARAGHPDRRAALTIGGRRYRDLEHPLRTVGAALEAAELPPRPHGPRPPAVPRPAGGLPRRRVDEVLAASSG